MLIDEDEDQADADLTLLIIHSTEYSIGQDSHHTARLNYILGGLLEYMLNALIWFHNVQLKTYSNIIVYPTP